MTIRSLFTSLTVVSAWLLLSSGALFAHGPFPPVITDPPPVVDDPPPVIPQPPAIPIAVFGSTLSLPSGGTTGGRDSATLALARRSATATLDVAAWIRSNEDRFVDRSQLGGTTPSTHGVAPDAARAELTRRQSLEHAIILTLRRLLDDSSVNVRAQALMAYGAVARDRGIEVALSAFGKGQESMEIAACSALGYSRSVEAALKLAAIAGDSTEGRRLVATTGAVRPMLRAAALRAIGVMGAEIALPRGADTDFLTAMAALTKEPAICTFAAVDALGLASANRAATASLLDLASKRSLDVHRRAAAIRALAGTGDRGTLNFLAESSRDPHPSIRSAAVAAIARLATPEDKVVSSVIESTTEGHTARDRYDAILALGEIGSEASRKRLAQILAEGDDDAATNAAMALGIDSRLHDVGESRRDWHAAAAKRLDRASDAETAADFLLAVALIADSNAAQTIREFADSKKNEALTVRAMTCLGLLHRESMTEYLASKIVDDGVVSAAAAESLGRVGTPKAFDRLVSLTETSPSIGWFALGQERLASACDLDRLWPRLEALTEASMKPEVKAIACRSLGIIGHALSSRPIE